MNLRKVLFIFLAVVSLRCLALDQFHKDQAEMPARAAAAESREVTLDPARDSDFPGRKFNQSQMIQFHNDEDAQLRLRNDAVTRRLDRIGRNRE